MFKSDNTTNILIGKDIARTATVQITDIGGGSYIADGEILVLDKNDNPLTPGDTFADTDTIRIVQGRGTSNSAVLKSSVVINGSGVIRASGASYRAAAEQVSYVGYNTSSGAIDAQPYTNYKLTIVYKHDDEMFAEQQVPRTFYYTTGASATQAEIAAAFVTLINADEFPGVVAASVNSGSDYGISLTGEALDFDFGAVGDFKYVKVAFDVQLSGFGTTTQTSSVASDRGNGTAEQVAEMEWFTNGHEGAINRIYHPVPAGFSDVVAGETYDILAIEHVIPSKEYTISGGKPVRNLLFIALPDGASQTSDVLAQLNPWLASLSKPFATITV